MDRGCLEGGTGAETVPAGFGDAGARRSPDGAYNNNESRPASTALSLQYGEITAWFRSLDLENYGIERYMDEIGVASTKTLSTRDDIAKYYWL